MKNVNVGAQSRQFLVRAGGEGEGPPASTVLGRKIRRREANSHIWHHHGGSLEKQLSGKYNQCWEVASIVQQYGN